jgi:hypothetical protein
VPAHLSQLKIDSYNTSRAMKPFDMLAWAQRAGLLLSMVILARWMAMGPGPTWADDPASGTKPAGKDPPPSTRSPPAQQAPARKSLTGAELYAVHCNRCHPERYAPERTPEQWKTILTHMRVRANIPAAQAREILKFLQENSGR